MQVPDIPARRVLARDAAEYRRLNRARRGQSPPPPHGPGALHRPTTDQLDGTGGGRPFRSSFPGSCPNRSQLLGLATKAVTALLSWFVGLKVMIIQCLRMTGPTPFSSTPDRPIEAQAVSRATARKSEAYPPPPPHTNHMGKAPALLPTSWPFSKAVAERAGIRREYRRMRAMEVGAALRSPWRFQSRHVRVASGLGGAAPETHPPRTMPYCAAWSRVKTARPKWSVPQARTGHRAGMRPRVRTPPRGAHHPPSCRPKQSCPCGHRQRLHAHDCLHARRFDQRGSASEPARSFAM